MITNSGQNLSILILTQPELEWQTFATWYSFYKNLPDAKIGIMNERNKKMPFSFYQWTKRLKIRMNTVNEYIPKDFFPKATKTDEECQDLNLLFEAAMANTNCLITDTVLFVRPLIMAVDVFDHKTLTRLNESIMIKDSHVWFMKKQSYNALIDAFMLNDWRQELTDEPLCVEAKDTEEPRCLVSYKKGCGKWIPTAVGCPFSSAGGLITAEMTANEHRINELWRKMVALYNAVM